MDISPTTQKKHNCAFGLCVKNNEKGLPKVFENLSKMRELFDETVVVVYYDESRDNSFELIKFLANKYNLKTVVLNANNSVKPIGRRTFDIARARNAIVEIVNKKLLDFEMFLMMDSNDYSCQGDIIVDVIRKYLYDEEYCDKWDALSFARNTYYDLWAYSDDIFQIGCWTYQRFSNTNVCTVFKYQDAMKQRLNETIFKEENKGKLVEVDSAFCGLAFYKKKAFENCYYNGQWTTKYMNKEFLKKNLELFVPPFNVETMEKQVVEDCEHRHFHMMAKHLNNAKIMIACDQAFTTYSDPDTNSHLHKLRTKLTIVK